MRVLLLSCDTGGGHNACAGAIQEAFWERGDHCDVTDSIRFVSEKLSRFLSWGHTTMYRHIPGLFRVGYGFAEKHPQMMAEEAAVHKLLSSGTEQLYDCIKKGEYDTVICTHVFSGLLLRNMLKKHPLPLRTAFVATDYTCSPGAAGSELDVYFIPSGDLTAEFAAQGIPAEKMVASGIPVRREFYEPGNKAAAKRKLGIAPEQVHLLMMCGSMGCGPLKELAGLLSREADETMAISIVCGTNEKLRNELQEAFGALPHVHIHGFVDGMAGLMDSADLYLTKPGGLSTTEAAAKSLPMVFVDAVAGCEAYNLQYFVRAGGAVTADDPEALTGLCIELLRSPERLEQMKMALAALPKQNAARRICQTMCADGKAAAV